MDHLRIMGFLVLLITTLSALQFAGAGVLEHHFDNAAHSHKNSAVIFDSDLDAVAVLSSRQNYSGPGGHVANYSASNPGSNSEILTHVANNMVIAAELSQKETTPGDSSSSNAPAGLKEVAPIEGNADILHEMLNSHSSPGVGHVSVNNPIEGNILSSGQSPGVGHWEKSTTTYSSTSPARTTPNNVLSSGPSPGVGNAHILSSGQSPGVGHWEKSTTTYSSTSPARTTPNNVLSSGPSPGVGNAHTSIAGTRSELGTFNKLPSGPSPGVGHKVTNGYTEMAHESESKKTATMMNILPSGPSPGVGHSATNGRNTMEKISIESESMKKAEITQDSQSKKKSAMMMNILSSGPSPGVGNSATNGRNVMEKMSKEKDEEGISIKTFNRLPSGSTPGAGHSYTNAHQQEKLERASEDRKDSDDTPIFEKLPGGPSTGGGHSYVQKSASRMRMQLSSNALRKSSSSAIDRNSSKNKVKATRSENKKVEQISGVPDWNIGCDGGGLDRLDSYGTPTPSMFGIATVGS